MIPVLFKGNETNFNHNGIGLLKDTLSCEVSEVSNGSFDLELVYPITGPHFKDLKNGNIIQAKPNDTDIPHNFRITEIDKTLSDKEVVVYGVSTTNDLGGNMVKSLYLEDLTPQVILNEMKNALHYPTSFNFVSNITTIGSVDWELNNPLNLIVGEEGSLVDIFGGEVKRTNDTIYLYGRRGKDNVTTIRAGKNLDGFKMTESFQGKYTQILPYFKYEAEIPGEIAGGTDGETIRQEVTVFGSVVSSPYNGRYPVNAIKPVDFSQNETVREAKTLDSLNAEAARYFSDLYSEIDKPSVNINVDMVQLVDSEQYELYEKLEKIELTDTVSVYVPEYDVDVLVKITELKYDSLRERTISIVAGSSGRTSLMDEISGSYKKFTTTLVDDKIQSATSGIINQILTKKDGGNVYAGRATPPDNAELGDIWFKDTGGGDVELYEFDGVNWIRKMYKGFGDDVRQLVDSKIAEANVTITEALEEHDNTIAQAMTNAGQANDLAQQAKTEAENASLSASAANQDAQKAITDAANAKTEALAQVSIVSQALDTAKTNLQNQVSVADSKAVKAQTDADGLKVKTDTTKQNLATYQETVNRKLTELTTSDQTLDGKITAASTKVDTVAGQIRTEISTVEGKIPKSIGGRNLAQKTSSEWSTPYTSFSGLSNTCPQLYKVLIDDLKVGDILKSRIVLKYTDIVPASGKTATILLQGPGNVTIWNMGAYISSPGKAISGSGEIIFEHEFKITADHLKNEYWNWQFRTDYIASGSLQWRLAKVEKGTVFTGWSQAPEDINNEISSVKTTITQTSQGVEQLTTSLATTDGKVTTAETKINQLIGDVSSKVSQTDYNTLNGRVTNAESNISQQATQIASKVSQTDFNAEKTKISSLQTSVTQHAGQIALKAEKTYVDTVKQTVDSTTSRVTLTEQSITSLVSGSKTLPDGRTSVFATKIESLEGAITQRVTTQELNNRGYQTATDVTNRLAGYVTNQTYTTYTTARQQTDGQITEKIDQTVSKVPTGPVNLIVNGFDPQTISPWTFGGTGHNLFLTTHNFFYKSQKNLYMLITSNTTEGHAWTNIFNLKRNTKYTIRLGLFAGSATKSCDIYFMGKPAGGSFSYQLLRIINDLSPSKVVYYTITFDSGSFDVGQFRIDNNGSWTQGTPAALYICEVSCIEGEMNNSWTPSFDELITETKFNETKSTVDAFSRAIGTRDENGVVPNIARLVMTQDAVISEVAKYGEHNNNLIVDAANHSQTVSIGDASLTKYPQYDRIDFSRSGATTNVYAGFECKVNNTRFRTGEKYTVSFEYYLHSAPDATVEIELKDGGTWLSGVQFATTSTATGTWYKFQHTLTMYSDSIPNSNNIRFKAWARKNGSVAIQKLMLVRGEKIGPYSTSQVDSVTTRVEQTANSYAIKFLNNSNDITTQLNMTSSGVRIKSSLIHLDGNVTVSGNAWMDGAIIKNLSADKITTGTLNANNVNITNLSVDDVSGITSTYLQSVIGTAFIDWMKGKTITAMNGNMAIDLNDAKITFNADAKIQFNSDDNALFRTKNGTSAFIHFRDDYYNGVYTAMGVNADNTGTQNDYSSGEFAGIRVIRTNPNSYSGETIDQVQIVGDEIRIRHAYGYEHDYLRIHWDGGSRVDLMTWIRQFNLNFKHIVNIIGRGDVIKSF